MYSYLQLHHYHMVLLKFGSHCVLTNFAQSNINVMYLKRFKFIIELVKISEVYCVTVMHWILKENCKSHLNLCRFYLVANYAEFGFCESHLHGEYSPEKWLHNTPVTGPNKSKKLTRLIALVHNIHGKVWRKNNIHGFTDKLLSVKPCRPMVLFI